MLTKKEITFFSYFAFYFLGKVYFIMRTFNANLQFHIDLIVIKIRKFYQTKFFIYNLSEIDFWIIKYEWKLKRKNDIYIIFKQ